MRRALLAALAALVLTLAGAGSALASSSLPTLLGNSGNSRRDELLVRPAQIVYTGDGSGILGGFDGGKGKGFGHLRWTHWSRSSASGHGAEWINGCTPNCAQGSYSAHKATVSAFRTRSGHFTRLTIRSSYRGKRVVSKLALVKSGQTFLYTPLR